MAIKPMTRLFDPLRPLHSLVAVEQCEAASGSEAVVKSGEVVFQEDRVFRFYDCCARARTEPNAASQARQLLQGPLLAIGFR